VALERKSPPFAKGAKDGAPSSTLRRGPTVAATGMDITVCAVVFLRSETLTSPASLETRE